MYCRTAIAKIMVGMKGLLVRVDGWRNTKCWIAPPPKKNREYKWTTIHGWWRYYGGLSCLPAVGGTTIKKSMNWRSGYALLFIQMVQRAVASNQSSGNLRVLHQKKHPKTWIERTKPNRFLAGWPAVNSLSQRGKLGSVLWNPSFALAPDMDHEIAQMSETWSNWLLRACSSICRCLQIWNWTWQHRPKPSIGNTWKYSSCNLQSWNSLQEIPSPRLKRVGIWEFHRLSTAFHDIFYVPQQRASPPFSWGRHQNIPQLLAPFGIRIFRLRRFAEVPPAPVDPMAFGHLGPLDTRTDPEKKVSPWWHGSLNVPIEHHPTIRYMVYNGYYKVMSNSPKMGHLPTPAMCHPKVSKPWVIICHIWSSKKLFQGLCHSLGSNLPSLAMTAYKTSRH